MMLQKSCCRILSGSHCKRHVLLNLTPRRSSNNQSNYVTCKILHIKKLHTTPFDTITITKPDDWHLHLRDGSAMESVVQHSAKHFARAVIMPNLVPPVTTTQMAMDYKQRILSALDQRVTFEPLMTLYLTDNTQPDEVYHARQAGIPAFKLYPAGATTNSSSGVTSIIKILPVLKAMAEAGVILLVHGEVTEPEVDIFDREAQFIQQKLIPLLEAVPNLKVVMEHITTKDAAEFVAAAPANVAATVTPQHMLLNRNAMLVGGMRPHNYCLPVLKREIHRQAVLDAATSGSSKFFLGTDSAPHAVETKESHCGCAGVFSAPIAMALYATAFEAAGRLSNLEAFASHSGPDFYGLPRNTGTITLKRTPYTIPSDFAFAKSRVIPLWAGKDIEWTVI